MFWAINISNRKDKNAYRLYQQLTQRIPDNKAALELLRKYNFYKLYWILEEKIFRRYGQQSQRAEAELSKMILLEVMFDYNTESVSNNMVYIYEMGRKKAYIIDNEMARMGEKDPECYATGHDRHVINCASYFNPYMGKDMAFVRLLCRYAKDWIKWSFNEITGQIHQGLQSTKGSSEERFSIHIYADMLKTFPQYKYLLMEMVKEKKYWARILEIEGLDHSIEIEEKLRLREDTTT